MKYAFFSGCKIPFYLKEYELSSKAVLNALNVELIDIEFNCCGYPIRSINFESFILFAARNMALAKKHNVDILTPCKCCYGSFMHAIYYLVNNPQLVSEINTILSREELWWTSDIQVKHLLTVLAHDIGIEKIKSKITNPLNNLKIAPSYGCHALRPGKIVKLDNPFSPTIFEDLVNLTGAASLDWPQRLDCCGNPLWEKNNEISIELLEKKLNGAKNSGADLISSACTYCQIQFDKVQNSELKETKISSILYPQLLGLSLGLTRESLGKMPEF